MRAIGDTTPSVVVSSGESADQSLHPLNWTKSTFCDSVTCVEVAVSDGVVLVRDSKDPSLAPFAYSINEWTAFIAGVRAGQFDV